jgi:hypothetical protein
VRERFSRRSPAFSMLSREVISVPFLSELRIDDVLMDRMVRAV